MKARYILAAVAALFVTAPAIAQITTTPNSDATQLGAALQGSGVTFTSATLSGVGETGTFSNGLDGTGIGSGVVLTSGGLGCVGSVNDQSNCSVDKSGSFDSASLALGFTATSESLFFNYVFASEEYQEYVNSAFNDTFSLTLNGDNYSNVNLAQVPGGGGVVSINNVNAGSNSAYYRNNDGSATSLGLPIQYDGLTSVLTASATNLVIGSAYTLTFSIADVGDNAYDSAVFVQGGSVGVVTPPVSAVPEPASWAMMMLGIGVIGGTLRRRRFSTAAMA